jgi:PKD repeat protein
VLIGGVGHAAQWATQNFSLEANDVVPTASFSITPNSGTAGSSVTFNGGTSSDPDGSIASYSWNFGDGSAAGSGGTASHTYAVAGNYTVALTVTDNGGQTATTTHAATVTAAPATEGGSRGGSGGSGGGPTALGSSLIPNDNFSALAATVDQKTGTITITASVADSGRFSWLLTFQNGRFGVFAAKAAKCKAGFVRLSGKCRPARVVFAKGSKAVAAPGAVTFTVKPTASAWKALRNALKRRTGVPVLATLTFQSVHGGSPVTHTRRLTVKLKRK